MDAQSAFRSLTAGTRFNKNKLAKQPAAALNRSDAKRYPGTAAAVIGSDDEGTVEKASSRKRKRNAATDETIEAPAQDSLTSTGLRKSLRIRCSGTDVPDLWPAFSDFPSLNDQILESLALMSVLQPTPIQMQASPIIACRRDLLACAPTGSGKTLAFLIPLFLLALSGSSRSASAPERRGPRAIVVEPTRELARQVFTEAGKIKQDTAWKVALLGDDDIREEDPEAEAGNAPDLLVSTPLKLVYAIKEKKIDLSQVEYLVLDEADRLFELGFLGQTDEILAACANPQLRKAMFSATIPSGVEELAKSVLSSDMIRIIIGGSDSATRTISQELTFAGTEDGKLIALKNIIKSGGLSPPALIFVQSIDRARDLNKELLAYNVKSDVMHSERTKEERDDSVRRFAAGDIWVLVCTDMMSRGVDFRGVQLVINYDFPQSVQSYIHRIGRTGRAGRSGRAITLFTKSDATYLRSIVNVMRNSGCEVPHWMLSLPAPSQNEKKKLRKRPVDRKDVSRATGSIGGGKGSKKHAGSGKKGAKTQSRAIRQARSASDGSSEDEE